MIDRRININRKRLETLSINNLRAHAAHLKLDTKVNVQIFLIPWLVITRKQDSRNKYKDNLQRIAMRPLLEPPFLLFRLLSVSPTSLNLQFTYATNAYFFRLNKLNKFIRARKDPLLSYDRCHVIYRIDCHDCDASFIG